MRRTRSDTWHTRSLFDVDDTLLAVIIIIVHKIEAHLAILLPENILLYPYAHVWRMVYSDVFLSVFKTALLFVSVKQLR